MLDTSSKFLLIRGGDVYGPQPLGRQDIVVCAGRIIEIGEGLSNRLGCLGPIETIEAGEKLVVPGFIDQHIHFLGGGDADGPLSRVPEQQAGVILRGGVTTAVGILGIDMDSKILHALLVKARELEKRGLSTYIYTGSFRLPSPYLTSSVRADVVLIDKVIGCKVAIGEDTYPNLSLPDLANLAGELNLAGKISGKAAVLHCHIGRNRTRLEQIFDLLDKVDLPITQILPTHINRREPDTLDHGIRFAKMGGTIDFTAILSPRSGRPTAIAADEAVKRALDAGVELHQITLSSDSYMSNEHACCSDLWGHGHVNVSPDMLHQEWRSIMRTNELKLDQGLPMITSNVARVLGLQASKGALKPGLDADIVLLNDDLDIDTVIARGNVMIAAGKPLTVGGSERFRCS